MSVMMRLTLMNVLFIHLRTLKAQKAGGGPPAVQVDATG